MVTTQAGQPKNNLFSLKKWLMASSKSRDILYIFFIMLAVLCFRRPDAFIHAQIFSEEGTNFLWGYETNGIKSLIFPMDQYFLILPHIVAIFFGILNINLLYIPLCYNISCFVITFLIAVQLWKSADYLGIKHKIMYATCFLFIPIGSVMYLKLIDLTYFAYLYIIDFLFVGYKHGNKYFNIFIVFIVSFTGPFGLIIVPLVVFILFMDRKKLSAYTLTAYSIIFISGIISFITTARSNIRHRSAQKINPSFALPPEHYHLLKLLEHNVSEVFFLNYHVFSKIPPMVHTLICLIIFAVVAYLFIRSYMKIEFEKKYVFLLVGILYFGSYIVAFWPNESKLTGFSCPRYYMIPYACMAWVFIIAWDQRIKLWHLGLYLLFFLKHSGNLKYTLYDKHWKTQILEYYQGKRDTIDINEGGPDWGWKMVLPKKK